MQLNLQILTPSCLSVDKMVDGWLKLISHLEVLYSVLFNKNFRSERNVLKINIHNLIFDSLRKKNYVYIIQDVQ
jgi:hypothetical protein